MLRFAFSCVVLFPLIGCADEPGVGDGDAGVVDGAFNDSSIAHDDFGLVDAGVEVDPCTDGGIELRLEFRAEYSNWYFGHNAGIRFAPDGGTTPLLDGELDTIEGVATISNADGQLLFYSDGISVWNREHDVMPHGTGLNGDPSSTQSGVIVPDPASANRYYLFSTANEGEVGGVRYSIIDMTLEGGLGDVMDSARDVPLHTPTTEKLVAVRHPNEHDYWIVTHDTASNCFRSWLLSATGLGADVTSCTGYTLPTPTSATGGLQGTLAIGQMKVDRTGTRLAVAHYNSVMSSPDGLRVELANFNRETGAVSDAQLLLMGESAYGVEFSPAGTRLYVSTNTGRKIHQFDLCSSDIAASDTLVANFTEALSEPDSISHVGVLQLGPDGRIYVNASHSIDTPNLSVIPHPDRLGTEAGFMLQTISTGGRVPTMGLPNFISFYARPMDEFVLF